MPHPNPIQMACNLILLAMWCIFYCAMLERRFSRFATALAWVAVTASFLVFSLSISFGSFIRMVGGLVLLFAAALLLFRGSWMRIFFPLHLPSY